MDAAMPRVTLLDWGKAIVLSLVVALIWVYSLIGTLHILRGGANSGGHDFGLGIVIVGWFWALIWSGFIMTTLPIVLLKTPSRAAFKLISIVGIPAGLGIAANLIDDSHGSHNIFTVFFHKIYLVLYFDGALGSASRGTGELYAAMFVTMWGLGFLGLIYGMYSERLVDVVIEN